MSVSLLLSKTVRSVHGPLKKISGVITKPGGRGAILPLIFIKNGLSSVYTSSVYTSNYFSVDKEEILSFVKNKQLDSQVKGNQLFIKECPFCPKPTLGKPDNLWKLNINLSSGQWNCFRCETKGSWFDLKSRLGRFNAAGFSGILQKHRDSKSYAPLPKQNEANAYSRLLDTKENALTQLVLAYLKERGLEENILREYGVGCASFELSVEPGKPNTSMECVTFPWICKKNELTREEQSHPDLKEIKNEANVIRRIKCRAVRNKGVQRLYPVGGGWGLFGWHLVGKEDTEVVVTEGEFDAIAVRQVTGKIALSLPNGCGSLPLEVLPFLEQFSKIYLWMDNDQRGREGAEKFAKKLGVKRVYIVRPLPDDPDPPKDANEALLRNPSVMMKMIELSTRLENKDILTVKDLRDDLLHRIKNARDYIGATIKSLPIFNGMIKGLRKGELTILSGPTGCGKTTVLSQISVDLVQEGYPVLWGSFEIKNISLLQKMLYQYTNGEFDVCMTTNTEASSAQLCAIMDSFQSFPLYFLRFHGGTDVEKVLEAMDYAVYVHDVQHIILDNLQFMVPSGGQIQGSYSSFARFDRQDQAVESFRKFATDKNVHIILVIHPRKEDDNEKLGISSVFGTGKATQEADTIVIIQKDDSGKCLDVKKNRHDGTIGEVMIQFNEKSKKMVETT